MTRQQLLGGRFGSDAIIAGRYEIRSLIGHGGVAEVYAAYDRALGRPVALKVLKEGLAQDRRVMARFRREARAVAALAHPNIISIHDVVAEGPVLFLVMELLHGEPLSEVIGREAPMAVERAVTIAESVARALAFAHDARIVHRDVKPANVMIGPGDHPKVLDFGIARAIAWTPLTDARPVQATVAYASPEQFKSLPLDARSDIYALGVVLFEMLTGVPPFQGDTIAALAYQHMHALPPALRALRPGIPPSLESIVTRCLAKEREDRFQSADALARSLHRFRRTATAQERAASSDDGTARWPSGDRGDRTPELEPDLPHRPGGISRRRRPRHRKRPGASRRRMLIGSLAIAAVIVAATMTALSVFDRHGAPARASRAAPTPPPLFAPTALHAESGCDGFFKANVSLAWLPSGSAFADGYAVYRATSRSGPYEKIELLAGRATTSFSDRHLNTSTTYYYAIHSTAGSRVSDSVAAAHADTPVFCLS